MKSILTLFVILALLFVSPVQLAYAGDDDGQPDQQLFNEEEDVLYGWLIFFGIMWWYGEYCDAP